MNKSKGFYRLSRMHRHPDAIVDLLDGVVCDSRTQGGTFTTRTNYASWITRRTISEWTICHPCGGTDSSSLLYLSGRLGSTHQSVFRPTRLTSERYAYPRIPAHKCRGLKTVFSVKILLQAGYKLIIRQASFNSKSICIHFVETRAISSD